MMDIDYILQTHGGIDKYRKTPKVVIPTTPQIYGVKIDTLNSNPETALTYTDNAIGFTGALGNNGEFNYGSWEDKFPFNKIKPCLLKNGVVNYYLNPNDFTKKLEGTASDITSGNDGDVMIEFPKIYWKFETIGTDLYIRYSDTKIDEGYKCLAHMRGTTEKDKCYISAYMGCIANGAVSSLTNKKLYFNRSINYFRGDVVDYKGVGYDLIGYYQFLMLQVLYTVMFKNRDSQTALGRGYVFDNDNVIFSNATDEKGMYYGENTGKLQMKFCGITDFWGNCSTFIDGIYCDSNSDILIGNQNFNDSGSGYTNYGAIATKYLVGFISSVQGGTETGFIIKDINGSITTGYCDRGYSNKKCVAKFGIHYMSNYSGGVYNLDLSLPTDQKSATIGIRMIYL